MYNSDFLEKEVKKDLDLVERHIEFNIVFKNDK